MKHEKREKKNNLTTFKQLLLSIYTKRKRSYENKVKLEINLYLRNALQKTKSVRYFQLYLQTTN